MNNWKEVSNPELHIRSPLQLGKRREGIIWWSSYIQLLKRNFIFLLSSKSLPVCAHYQAVLHTQVPGLEKDQSKNKVLIKA